MGAGASVEQDGKLDVTSLEDFKAAIEKAWDFDNGSQRAELKKMLGEARKVIGKKARENSVGKIPFPPEETELERLWKQVDYNGNQLISLAELDKLVVESYPEYDNKPAIMRAYHACDRNGNGFITRREFRSFFGYLDYFTKLWEKFESVDDNHDRRIDFEEMKKHSKDIFGRELSEDAAAVMFETMDRNGGGKILFYEFAAHMAVLDQKDFSVGKLPFE